MTRSVLGRECRLLVRPSMPTRCATISCRAPNRASSTSCVPPLPTITSSSRRSGLLISSSRHVKRGSSALGSGSTVSMSISSSVTRRRCARSRLLNWMIGPIVAPISLSATPSSSKSCRRSAPVAPGPRTAYLSHADDRRARLRSRTARCGDTCAHTINDDPSNGADKDPRAMRRRDESTHGGAGEARW